MSETKTFDQEFEEFKNKFFKDVQGLNRQEQLEEVKRRINKQTEEFHSNISNGQSVVNPFFTTIFLCFVRNELEKIVQQAS